MPTPDQDRDDDDREDPGQAQRQRGREAGRQHLDQGRQGELESSVLATAAVSTAAVSKQRLKAARWQQPFMDQGQQHAGSSSLDYSCHTGCTCGGAGGPLGQSNHGVWSCPPDTPCCRSLPSCAADDARRVRPGHLWHLPERVRPQRAGAGFETCQGMRFSVLQGSLSSGEHSSGEIRTRRRLMRAPQLQYLPAIHTTAITVCRCGTQRACGDFPRSLHLSPLIPSPHTHAHTHTKQ